MPELKPGATVRCYLEDDAGGHVLRKGTVTYINRRHGWFLATVILDHGEVRQGYHIVGGLNYEPQFYL